jgi:uncharacterized damage-inducible protein DinB
MKIFIGGGKHMSRYNFLVETYETERLKTLSVWSQIPDHHMDFRPEPRARTPLEHMVHQCLSEEAWMTSMLDITVRLQPLPEEETRLAFLLHYANCSQQRVAALSSKTESWFEEAVPFFDVIRSRAWILTRRFTHSAHHRGQLMTYLRLWGEPVYSNYGPTADTGGLAKNGARVIYRYGSVEELLVEEARGGLRPALPGTGPQAPTER